jgi:nitroreductase
MSKTALTAAPILPVIAERWSPRSYEPDFVISQHDMLSVLEAARWAPSANNEQPWRFSVLNKGSELHTEFSATLSGWNQAWAPKASAIIVVSIVHKKADGTDIEYAMFDAGLAVATLCLQAQELGLHTHQMAGFDHAAAGKVLGLDDHTRTLVAITIGKLGSPELLEGPLHERELTTRVRHQLDDIVLHGKP